MAVSDSCTLRTTTHPGQEEESRTREGSLQGPCGGIAQSKRPKKFEKQGAAVAAGGSTPVAFGSELWSVLELVKPCGACG